ncbi:MAG: hypothetical protein ACFFHV_09500 [Promethearchaeota archaeon]
MGIEDLTQQQMIDGIIGLIYPAVGILIGGLIASKYAAYKRKELLFVGLSLIFMTTPWLALGITFITMVFFDFVLQDNIYFFIYIAFVAFSSIFWIWAMAILLAPASLKKIVPIYSVVCLTYEIYIIAMLIINPYSIMHRAGPMEVDAAPIIPLFTLFAAVLALVTMFIFVRNLLKSENVKMVWRGRFLFVSIICLVIALIIVISNTTNIGLILISRILYIAQCFFSYLGWLLPNRVAKLIIKENE